MPPLGFIKDNSRVTRAARDHLLALADFVKVSDEDLNWITPRRFALRDKVADLLIREPSSSILHAEARGATRPI